MQEFADFIIIGSGVAGLRAAIELAPHGDVLVVTKDIPTESSTEYAQGGIAVALSDEDEIGIHHEDTVKAGDGMCLEDAVEALVTEGPRRIHELIAWGADFDREGPGLAFTLEAAHSRKRVLHAHGDATGRELERVLLQKVKSLSSVSRFPFTVAMDLIISKDACVGVRVLRNRKKVSIFARATVLSSGGGGQIFSVTTNPLVATADGIAMAYRAGAVVQDMEFVQFHPTSLYLPDAPNFLLSEAMRGEGALLRNINGETFMPAYHPSAELAPRDVVSRAIISEMVRTESKHVYLDLTALGGAFVRKRFPKIYATCLKYGVDITKVLVPVSPAAHYMMGGVKTDTCGVTSLRGLFAAGEAACTGLHGANRLASNSLLEGLVYGKRAGEAAIAGALNKRETIALTKAPGPHELSHSIPAHDEIRGALRKLMWDKVGIIRCEESLNEAKEALSKWKDILNKEYLTRREIELKNMIQAATLITAAALARKGSVGAHYRSDYPGKGRNWRRHLAQSKGLSPK